MNMTDEILERAKLYISRTLTENATEGLRLLCSAAEIRLRKIIRKNVDINEIHEIYVTACAILALSMYVSVSGDEFSSAKIGSISITKTQGKSLAEELKNVAQSIIGSYVDEAEFKFMGVIS